MSIDEFGLGARWPRPDQAANGALDRLPPDQWPVLAARWLAAGFDSPVLRQLAKIQVERPRAKWPAGASAHGWAAPRAAVGGPPGTARLPAKVSGRRAAMDLMPEVLRSIGFDPAPADEAFVARCRSALDIVQRDLDATGYGQYRIRAYLGGWPATVLPALLDGSYWAGGEAMSRAMEGSRLLLMAAYSVSDVLKEIPEVEWPVCVVHGGHPAAIWDGEDPVDLIDEVAWWQCTNTGHALAPVGQLSAEVAKTL
jgi:hypothetical protein